MSTDFARELLGWCVVFDLGLLMLSALMLKIAGPTIIPLHSRLFHVPEADLPLVYFRFLGRLKVAALVLHVVPYLALLMVD